MGSWITPLNLTDPSSVDFRAERCQTLHDVVRFVHEKLYAAMFGFGDKAAQSSARSWKLQVKLPMTILVADLGGGLTREPSTSEPLRDRDIASTPFQAFLVGLLDGRIDWTKPRNVSGSGFMSVVGEAMLGPPAETQNLAQPSYAVLAHQYMSFSGRAGYHFSVIEAICSTVGNNKFVQYTFAGGGAGEERRGRRAAFLQQVLSTLGFAVQVKGDLVTARFLRSSGPDTRRLLIRLGQLTLCSRQLDMLMDSDDSPKAYAAAFLESRFEQF
jgi:pyruvate,water dikinase